jgi:ammonia channel protein AmtB
VRFGNTAETRPICSSPIPREPELDAIDPAATACAKFRFGYDDSLDVVGVHFVGGVIGVLLIGFLATKVMTGGALSSVSRRWVHWW